MFIGTTTEATDEQGQNMQKLPIKRLHNINNPLTKLYGFVIQIQILTKSIYLNS